MNGDSVPVLNKLLEYKPTPGPVCLSCLLNSATSGPMVERLLELGAQLGEYPCFWATNAEVLRALLRAGADPTTTNENGWTALMWATCNRRTSVVEALCSIGYLDLDETDRIGWTALWYAIGNGHLDCTRALVDAGASPNVMNPNGVYMMSFAVRHWELKSELVQCFSYVVAHSKVSREAKDQLISVCDAFQVARTRRAAARLACSPVSALCVCAFTHLLCSGQSPAVGVAEPPVHPVCHCHQAACTLGECGGSRSRGWCVGRRLAADE